MPFCPDFFQQYTGFLPSSAVKGQAWSPPTEQAEGRNPMQEPQRMSRTQSAAQNTSKEGMGRPFWIKGSFLHLRSQRLCVGQEPGPGRTHRGNRHKMCRTRPLLAFPTTAGRPSLPSHPGSLLFPTLTPQSVLRAQILLFFFFLREKKLQSETFSTLFILKTIYKGNNNILWLLALIAPGIIYASLLQQHTPCHALVI